MMMMVVVVMMMMMMMMMLVLVMMMVMVVMIMMIMMMMVMMLMIITMMMVMMMMMVMKMINSGCWYCHKNGFSDSSEWFHIIYDRQWWYLASSAHGAKVMIVLWWLLMCIMQWSGDFTLGCKGPSTIQPQSMNPANSNAVQKKKRNTLGVAAFKVTSKVCETNGTRFSAGSLSGFYDVIRCGNKFRTGLVIILQLPLPCSFVPRSHVY